MHDDITNQINREETEKAIDLLKNLKRWLNSLPTKEVRKNHFDSALDAVNEALTETRKYQRHIREGGKRNQDTEDRLSKLWGDASSEIRPYDQGLAYLCWVKGQGWADEAVWNNPEYKDLPIDLDEILKHLRGLSKQRPSVVAPLHTSAPIASWIFGSLLLLFLLGIIILRPALSDDQRVMIRFLMSLISAFFALFFVGGVLMKGTIKGFALSATGGFVLFILLQFIYNPFEALTRPPSKILDESTVTDPNGLFRLRVTVIDSQGIPVDDARVWSSIGGEAKKVPGGWQFDIPAASKPHDGKLTIYASRESAFLTGNVEVVLSNDYNPAKTIQLKHNDSAKVRGQVVDGRNHAIVGARVFVIGYEPDAMITREGGNFELPAHAAIGQQVLLHAEKVGYRPVNLWHPAGDTPAILVLEK